jgi:2-oxoisovalerate dehydrogenase E2 component (dihydrolipoyl transacylase)
MAVNIHVIKVPDVGEGIAEVELVAWHVKPGDAVAEDQALADVMTDKASVEIPSPVAGRVSALGGEVGQMLAVGSELIRIELAAATDAPEPAPAPKATTAPAPAPSPAPSPAPAPAPVPTPAPAAATKPVAAASKAAAVKQQRPEPPPPSARVQAERPIASPALRRRAWELGVDLREVVASGSGGRIVQADLDAHVAAHGARPAPAGAGGGVERTDTEEVKVIGVRRRIAVQMQESKRRIPHFSYVEEIDVTEVEALRAAMNQKWSAERGRLTLLPLLMRALVLAVREFPQINARFDDEAGIVTRHGAVHIGIATQTQHGLMVPVVRHAEARSVWTMAAEVTRLADAARAGRATRDEMSGSTITISSLGALGGIVSTPVINRPEVAIVAVNRMVERPMMRSGAVVPRQMMNLSSSFDHRVVDGIDAAQFVQALRSMLEAPALLFVE